LLERIRDARPVVVDLEDAQASGHP
jgi:hypothetical protein